MEVPGLPAVGTNIQSSLCMGHWSPTVVGQEQGRSTMGRLSPGNLGCSAYPQVVI